MIKIRDLAAKAGRLFSAKPETAPAPQTGVVACDRFDAMTWGDVRSQSRALRDLADDLHVHHDYADELAKDLFLAAYKADPRLREPVEPGRAVNRQVITSLLDSPEFAELRRETVGDPYASAMAVISHTSAIRRLLEQAEQAQRAAEQAAQAGQRQQAAAQAVAEAIASARAQAGEDGEDGEVDDDAAAATEELISVADQAGQDADAAARKLAQALAQAAPGMHATAQAAAAQAADQARDEAAFMRAWGIGPGELERMDFATRARLAERLRSGRLAQYARLIGRFRQMAAAQRARRVENVPGEVVGIELGSDISRLIPAELASLAVPGMREEFISRLADSRALVYAQRGETHAGQGAIICCVDCSHSMSYPVAGAGISGEAWAKAFALSLLDQARAEKRDFAGILFSSAGEVKVFRLPAGQATKIADVIEFGEHFFGGGTDFETPLTVAMQILAGQFDDKGVEHGDIALITDGICDVSQDWMRIWQDARARLGFRCFGIRIGTPAGSILDALSDNVRAIEDLTDLTAAADVFRAV